MPSIRALCASRGLSKATVQHALQRLEARGFIECRPKSGYYVRAQLPVAASVAQDLVIEPREVTTSELLLDIMRRGSAFDIHPGGDERGLTPELTALNRALGRSLRRGTDAIHHYYDEPAGVLSLRQQIGLLYGRRGLQLEPEQICITSGCQHALFLALKACCVPGDIVAVESPGFYGVLQLLEQLQLKVVEVPTHSEFGMDMAAFEQVLTQWPVRACVITPAFSTPTGALMPQAARRRLLDLARRYDLALIEDDIYAETALGVVPDPLKALDTDNRVMVCGSFSKCLSRDLRLGWVSGARWHDQIVQLKLVTQLASSQFLQHGLADFIANGSFFGHIRRQRLLLRAQRDWLLARLAAAAVAHRVSVPQGGLCVWIELDAEFNVLELYAGALQRGVHLTPGPLFSTSGRYHNYLRLSYVHPWSAARVQAVDTLLRLLSPSAASESAQNH